MFWIPLCIIVFIIYLIASMNDAIKTGIYRREYDNYKRAADALAAIAVDRDLESDLDYLLELQSKKWKDTVREFMGGDPEWEDYTDFASGKLKAKMIIMAQHGKLPSWCISYGERFPLSEETRFKPGPHQIRPVKGIEMNERFILKLESYLRNDKHIPVIAYVWTTAGSDNRTVHMPLRAFIQQYDRGSTHYDTRFQFISGS